MLRKPLLARFYIDPGDLTEQNLAGRLLIGFESWSAPDDYKNQFINKLPSIINEYWWSWHHGLDHSLRVISRLHELAEQSPKIMAFYWNNLPAKTDKQKEQKIAGLLHWAAILHDLGRFFGFSLEDHQQFGAILARSCFDTDLDLEVGLMAQRLYNLIACHDYLTPQISGYGLPQVFYDEPLAELFRLADKTLLTPAEEMKRYYETGKWLKTPFYKPELTDDARFDFSTEEKDRDALCYAMILFAIQPQDFLYQETATAYAEWAKGKYYAFRELIRQAREENLSAEDILKIHGIMERFFAKFNLPNYAG